MRCGVFWPCSVRNPTQAILMAHHALSPLTKIVTYPRWPNIVHNHFIPPIEGPLPVATTVGGGSQVARVATQLHVNSDALPSCLGESPRCA